MFDKLENCLNSLIYRKENKELQTRCIKITEKCDDPSPDLYIIRYRDKKGELHEFDLRDFNAFSKFMSDKNNVMLFM